MASSFINFPSKNTALAGLVIAFFGAVLFSTKAIIVKKAFAEIRVDAITLLSIRMVFALPFYLLAAYLVSAREGNQRMSRKEWILTIVLGLFGYYLSSLFDFMGLQYISAGLERLILFLYPTFAVLINTFFFRQPLYRNQVLALVLTYLGIALAYIGEIRLYQGGPDFFWGSFLVFLCSLTYAVYIAGSGRMIPRIGPNKFTAYAMLSATAGVLLHYLVEQPGGELPATGALIRYGLLLAVVATVLPSFLISLAMKKAGASNVAIISSVGPVSTIIQAHYVLGEPIHTGQLVGTGLVLSGVLLLSWKPGKKT